MSYLSNDTKNLLRSLRADEDLARNQKAGKTLRTLWPMVLRDALKCLKRNDSRETPPGGAGDFEADTFFNELSLGLKNLEEVLKAFDECEPLLYGASPGYRDHIAHTFRVWAIGHGLLKSAFAGKLHADMPDGLGDVRVGEWEAMWAIAALCHDIGYFPSAIEDINQKADQALRSQGLYPASGLRYAFSPRLQPLQEAILRLMASKIVKTDAPPEDSERVWFTHLQNKYYMKLVSSFDEMQHGVLSALVLGKSLTYFLESDLCHDNCWPLKGADARQFVIRKEILRAIAAHTCPAIYHLRFDTLSFVLFVVDELQVWGRPTFEKLPAPVSTSKDDKVKIGSFEEKNINVCIELACDWTDDVQKGVKEHVEKTVKQRLRLAVDTEHLRDHILTWEVKPQDGEKPGVLMRLADGKIEGP
ncbi:MAG: hypothetical protein ISS74_01535 [Planctomycetes bacterium]|nr:hypothetical protein [Planctomycetota bacterium]